MDKPLVSIVMPNYNCEKYIGQTIESVLSQSYEFFEFIIIDDGSTDNSRLIINSFQDERIVKCYLEKNEHICYALNYGLNIAKGNYIARIDSDDRWLPNKLEMQITFMEKNPEYGACFTWVTVVDEQDNVLTAAQTNQVNYFKTENREQYQWLRQFYFNGSCLCHPSVVMRKSVVEEVGIYNYSLVQIQDYEMWIRIVKKYSIYVIQEPLIKYRWFLSGSNLSAPTKVSMMRSEYEFTYVLAKFFDDIPDDMLVEGFGEDFVRKGTTNHEELSCERMFLLLKPVFCGHAPKIGGMNKFGELLENDKTRNILREIYGITQKNFYELSASPVFFSNVSLDDFSTIAMIKVIVKRVLKPFPALLSFAKRFYQFFKR